MNNIESFNIAVAEVFGQCYKSFPIPIFLPIKPIAEVIKAPVENDIDMHSKEYKIARESVNWLVSAGYLWSEGGTEHSFKSVTLTAKGLEVMNAIPDGLKNKTTLGQQLAKGVTALGKEAALSAVSTGLSLGAKLMFGE